MRLIVLLSIQTRYEKQLVNIDFKHIFGFIKSRLTIVSREVKKKQAYVTNECVIYR